MPKERGRPVRMSFIKAVMPNQANGCSYETVSLGSEYLRQRLCCRRLHCCSGGRDVRAPMVPEKLDFAHVAGVMFGHEQIALEVQCHGAALANPQFRRIPE